MTLWGWFGLFMELCAVGAVLVLLLPERYTALVTAWVGTSAGLVLTWVGGRAVAGAPPDRPLWALGPVGRLVLHLDALSGVFLMATGLVFLAASLYVAGALERLRHRYNLRGYALASFALMAACAWILTAADAFSFLVAWELMSLLVYLLVSYEHKDPDHTAAGTLMLCLGEAGALAALIGLLLLGVGAHSLAFADVKTASGGFGQGLRWAVFLLTFFGFGAKAGLLPFNFWLPGAYTAAPAPFAPVLAGATMNLGLYGIFRVDAVLLGPWSVDAGLVMLAVGSLTALVGILYATVSEDMKTVLAHSSIENAGIITASLGASAVFLASGHSILAGMALLVSLYHMVNHSLFKTLLFVGAGSVEEQAGTRDLNQLGGLIRRMPLASVGILVGVLSIAALPPFNGFVSEWLTLQVLLRSVELSSTGVKLVFALCGVGLALTAALAALCFAKFFAMGFLGMSRSDAAREAGEASRPALSGMAVLGVLCLLLGVFPTYVIAGLGRAVRPVTGAGATAALAPPFFPGSPGHRALPAGFASDFHKLGAQVGHSFMPGPGLVILHRGGAANPVVFAGAPTYLAVVLLLALGGLFVVLRLALGSRRKVVRRGCWDGGIRRLLPEMTYTATGFSNPVRVIFQAVLRPTTGPDTRETVARHFRTAIRRHPDEVHIVDRLVRRPLTAGATALARALAHMHRGRLNAYLAYVLVALLVALVWYRWL